ncbi:hypothetical protein P280DRAFT_547554 [Massarina eburnea CBS 473.64]|uniref:Uncharacterized protein n=1 Tax=Massarina eburnea CBS 473.64 TaxID=1395130 RepID=A0A6A6S9I3_9PLEO|nr:hypothetical protein P280DRAFT_547554 [Massarina eburnea CBS 473.64]
MPEITFIFGPHNSFFFDCPKIWKFHNIPQTLRQLFNSSMSPAWRVAQPFCLALAPQNNTPEAIWYIGCKVLSGEEKIFYSQGFFDQHYPDLSQWSKTIPNAPRSCFVTFGTGHSYFASAPGRGSVWAGIPGELSDKIQKAYDTPCCVALGSHSSWFVMWPDGHYSWKFHGHYNDLNKILDTESRSVSYLALSPYNKEHYFVAFRDRTIKYNFTGAPPEWMQQMQEVFSMWQSELAQIQAYPHPPQPYAQLPNISYNYPLQQWNADVAPPHQSPQPGYMSPQTPNTPMSAYSYSNMTSPPISPNPPSIYASHALQQTQAVEMMGDMPVQPPGSMLAAPLAQVQRSGSTDKKRKSLFKLFN